MPFDFLATESGFEDGMGGASNASSSDESHYVLFGKDGESVYFEFDDQIHGGVNQVVRVSLRPEQVVFELRNSTRITVRKQMGDKAWNDFIAGVQRTFPPTIVAGP